MLTAVVALTSCNYEPGGWHGTTFEGKSSEVVFDKSKIDYAFGPEEGTTIQIPVSRGTATEAFTTRIQILDAQGNSIAANPDFALMAIEQAKFEVGEYEAVATLTFDRRQFTAGTKVGFYLQMEPTQIKDDVVLIPLTILRDYTWNEYCTATLEGQFFPMVGIPNIPGCKVYKADGFPFYRIYNGMFEVLDIEFKFVDGVLTIEGKPDQYGSVLFDMGITINGMGAAARGVSVDPEYTYYVAEANAVVSEGIYYFSGSPWNYITDVWYCDKALVTE